MFLEQHWETFLSFFLSFFHRRVHTELSRRRARQGPGEGDVQMPLSCTPVWRVCVPLQRSRINIREQRGWRKQASLAYVRHTAPAYSVTQHPQHTYIHRHTHAHTHIQVTCEIHAHAHTAIVYYDSLQLTCSMHKDKDKGHRAHGQKEIIHAYGPKSTPITQGLVEDIDAMYAYGRSSAPIAQGLLYDINAPHAFGLRESKPNAMHALRA